MEKIVTFSFLHIRPIEEMKHMQLSAKSKIGLVKANLELLLEFIVIYPFATLNFMIVPICLFLPLDSFQCS